MRQKRGLRAPIEDGLSAVRHWYTNCVDRQFPLAPDQVQAMLCSKELQATLDELEQRGVPGISRYEIACGSVAAGKYRLYLRFTGDFRLGSKGYTRFMGLASSAFDTGVLSAEDRHRLDEWAARALQAHRVADMMGRLLTEFFERLTWNDNCTKVRWPELCALVLMPAMTGKVYSRDREIASTKVVQKGLYSWDKGSPALRTTGPEALVWRETNAQKIRLMNMIIAEAVISDLTTKPTFVSVTGYNRTEP